MIAVILYVLAAADPVIPAGASVSFTRVGIACSESVDPSPVSLTDDVRLTLTAEGAAPLAVEPVTFGDSPGWRVRATEPPTVVDRPAGRQKWTQSFRLSPDRPGDMPVQPHRIRVHAAGRETPVEIDWRPLTVQVTTSLARVDLDEARGVTGPEPAPAATVALWRDERVWAALIGVIAVTAAVFAGCRQHSPPVSEPPPAEWVAGELERLAKSEPDADALAATVRGFLARQFHIAAVGDTTKELVTRLGDLPEVADWRALLDRCDVARFANVGFTGDGWADILDQARRVIAVSLTVGEPARSTVQRPTGENT
jgi:hypothetical protein